MKVLLLNDTTNWYHYGCTATSTSLIEGFRKITKQFNTISILETYKIKNSPKTKEGFLDQGSYNSFEKSNYALVNEIKKYDAIVINGEGTLHGMKNAPLSLLYLAYIIKTILKKHVEIVNHSVYPQNNTEITIDSEESKIYKLVYESLDYVAIREPLSIKTMKKLNIDATSCFDCMPLYIRDHYINHNNKLKYQILISGSAAWLQFNIDSDEKNDLILFKPGLEQLNSYVSYMVEAGFNVIFLIGANAYQAEDDIRFMEYMKNEYSTNWSIYEATSTNNWLSMIEESSLLISGRFHHTIAAACLNTPYITFTSNTPKIHGLLQILNFSDIIQYSDPHIYNKLLQQTEQKLSNNTESTDLDLLYDLAENNFLGIKNFSQFFKLPN